MALVQCPACKKDISSEAAACPGCGHPMQTGIRCPACKSADVKKITGASKVGSALVWGVFALGKLAKTYECNKCGYRW